MTVRAKLPAGSQKVKKANPRLGILRLLPEGLHWASYNWMRHVVNRAGKATMVFNNTSRM